MGDVYGDGPDWIERSDWTYRSELKRWMKCWLSSTPGRVGSMQRRHIYGFRHFGSEVMLCEGLWVDYSGNLDFDEHVGINRNCTINAGGGVTVSDWCLIGPNVTVYCQYHGISRKDVRIAFAGNWSVPVCLERSVWLGADSWISSGPTLGEGVGAAAGGVVSQNPLPYAVGGRVSARVNSRMQP